MPAGSRRPTGRHRRQPAVMTIALIRVERHARGARIPDRKVRLRRHVSRGRRQRPAIGGSRVQPQRSVSGEEVIRERIDAAVIRHAHATRVAPALRAPGHRELRVGLRAVVVHCPPHPPHPPNSPNRPTTPTPFGEYLDSRRAHLPFARDELHSAGDGGGARQRAQRAPGDLDTLHVREQDAIDVAEAAADVDRDPVEHDLGERLVTATEVKRCRAARTGGLADRHAREERERPRRPCCRTRHEVLALEDRRGESELLRRGRSAARRHDQGREIVAV